MLENETDDLVVGVTGDQSARVDQGVVPEVMDEVVAGLLGDEVTRWRGGGVAARSQYWGGADE